MMKKGPCHVIGLCECQASVEELLRHEPGYVAAVAADEEQADEDQEEATRKLNAR